MKKINRVKIAAAVCMLAFGMVNGAVSYAAESDACVPDVMHQQGAGGVPEVSTNPSDQPSGIDGGQDGMMDQVNNKIPPRKDCLGSLEVGGTAHLDNSGKGTVEDKGSSLNQSNGEKETSGGTGTISGTTEDKVIPGGKIPVPGEHTQVPGDRNPVPPPDIIEQLTEEGLTREEIDSILPNLPPTGGGEKGPTKIDTPDGFIIMEPKMIPGGDWYYKVTYKREIEYGDRIEGSESDWVCVRKVLEYGYWDWTNMTNEDWKLYHHEGTYYPITGTASTSKTPGGTSIAWTLGHGPYDDGTWSIRMTPYYTHYMERTYLCDSTSTETSGDGGVSKDEGFSERVEKKTIRNVRHEPTYYKVTVPLVCDTCPEVQICLGPDAPCDCDDLNTKCDDSKDPELDIEVHSELTK